MEITKEQWEVWKQDPVTLEVQRLLRAARLSLQDQWAAGQFQGETRDEILTLNAAALGQHKVYQLIEELTWEQLKEGLEDD